MEEMQKAFNKTIIKLQNTSRIAEEQVSNGSLRLLSQNCIQSHNECKIAINLSCYFQVKSLEN